MQPLDQLVEEQKAKQLDANQKLESSMARAFFLHFGLGDGQFIIPIEQVDEVLELNTITPFPSETPGYLGIVNLRGQVLPVISIAMLLGDAEAEKKLISQNRSKRLIRIHLDDQRNFCVVAEFVKKVALEATNHSAGRTINLNGHPARFLNRDDLYQVAVKEVAHGN